MSINGVNGLNGVSAANQTSAVNRNHGAETNAKAVARDEMEISTQNGARAADSVAMNPNEIRFDLVNRIRSEIAAGTYYTDEKLEIALGRMFDSFAD